MAQNYEGEKLNVLDTRQLVRIEAVHRGFLYQHLYLANCLLRAALSGIDKIVVTLQETERLGQEYYDLLGLSPEQVIGRNPPAIRPPLPKGRDNRDDARLTAETWHQFLDDFVSDPELVQRFKAQPPQ